MYIPNLSTSLHSYYVWKSYLGTSYFFWLSWSLAEQNIWS